MKKLGFVVAAAFAVALAGCNAKKEKAPVAVEETEEMADSTVYGVCGDGTSMHSLELVTDAGDTLTYTIVDAEGDITGGEAAGSAVSHVVGGLMAGDKLAVTGQKLDGELVADRVINVTSLLGHWTSIDKNFEIEEGGTVRSSVKAESNPWTSWKILNGRLLLNRDTFDINSLGADSLYIESARGIFTFKRQL